MFYKATRTLDAKCLDELDMKLFIEATCDLSHGPLGEPGSDLGHLKYSGGLLGSLGSLATLKSLGSPRTCGTLSSPPGAFVLLGSLEHVSHSVTWDIRVWGVGT